MTGTDGVPADVQEAKDRVFSEPDRSVWVVERNPGSGWRVSAVLSSFDDAEQYRDDLRTAMNHYEDGFPEEFKQDTDVRIRHGSRQSPTKMWEDYPPETGTNREAATGGNQNSEER